MKVMLVWLCGVLVAYWISPVSPVTEASTATQPTTTECPKETLDGYDWPSISAGTNTSHSGCPGVTLGTVYRFCRSDATWEVADYTRCVSPTLASLNTQTGNLDGSPSGYLHLAEDLQNASKPAKLVVSGDLLTAVTIMYALVEDSFLVTCNATSAVVMNFTEAVLISARQLLDNSYSSLWTETHQVSDVDAIFTFLEKLDSFYGDVLSCFSLVNITEYSLVTENLDVAIEVFQANTSEAFIFPSNSNSDANQATVPVAVFTEADTSGHTAACIVWYKSASSLLPSTDINARSAHQDGQINSDVVSVTLHPTQVQPFNEPITLRFSHHQAGNNPVCALLDVSLTSSSVWSDSECETVSTTSDVTTCNCHHATNFALLTTLNDDDTVLKVPLNAIMVTGVVISLLFLVATFVLLLYVNRSLESDWALVVKCFLLTYIIGQITFLSGINSTENQMICRFVGILLHYLYLSVFFWMLAQAVLLQLKIVHASATSATISHYCLLGWVTPLLVVASAAGLKHDQYGHDKYCWISIWNKVIYAFIGPAAFVILVTFVVTYSSVHGYFSIKKTDQKGAAEMGKLKHAFRAPMITLPLLMITWTLKAFAIELRSEALYAIFALTYIIQGMVIFVFYGVLDNQVQTLYRSKFGHNHKAVHDSSGRAWNDKVETNKTSPNNFRASSMTSFSSRASESFATNRNDSTASLSSSTARRLNFQKKTLVIPLKRPVPSPTPSQTQGTST
ncbi:adhesion G protein-coupled receptor B1-like isoform X3 [Ptychodera flava]|uniref:adhesion G protein-coupled receptor B1-like isoform X3 n=1 Tax=Ptychodera flava TaxID=63121 RepID=UPI00396A8233